MQTYQSLHVHRYDHTTWKHKDNTSHQSAVSTSEGKFGAEQFWELSELHTLTEAHLPQTKIHPDQWTAQNSSRAEGKDAGRMQQMKVKQSGKLGQREGGGRETERGPREVWSIFSFLKWDIETWKLQWQRQTVDFSKLTSHQAAGKQAAGKRNKRFYIYIIYISSLRFAPALLS